MYCTLCGKPVVKLVTTGNGDQSCFECAEKSKMTHPVYKRKAFLLSEDSPSQSFYNFNILPTGKFSLIINDGMNSICFGGELLSLEGYNKTLEEMHALEEALLQCRSFILSNYNFDTKFA